VPVAFLVFVASRSRPWTASGSLLAVTFLFGGVIGTVVAGQWEFTAMQELGTVPTFAVGAAEETAKLIVPVLVWIGTRHRRAVDGLVLGIASGMGFAALETMGYGFVALLSTRGNLAAVDELLFVRGIMAPATHAAWAGLAGAALFAAIASRGRAGPVLRFFVAFAAAVTLHALWDSNHSWPGYLVLGPISLALLLVAMRRAVRADGAGFGIR
jgi:RsiW-degrading membrane proteinase PrsW (M82 family)